MTTAAGDTRLTSEVIDAAISARALSVVILFSLALAAIGLATSDAFYISSPAVLGNQRVPTADIIAASQLETLHVAWLQPEHARQVLLKNMPELADAQISCRLPAVCTIQVVERQPAFEWRQGQVRSWVDMQGTVFPARGQTPDIPIVEAPPALAPLSPDPSANVDLVNTVLALAQALPEIKSYRYTKEHGVEFSDPRGHWPVFVGLGTDAADRAAIWRALSASLTARNIRPKFVDVHLASAPFYAR